MLQTEFKLNENNNIENENEMNIKLQQMMKLKLRMSRMVTKMEKIAFQTWRRKYPSEVIM